MPALFLWVAMDARARSARCKQLASRFIRRSLRRLGVFDASMTQRRARDRHLWTRSSIFVPVNIDHVLITADSTFHKSLILLALPRGL